MRDEVGEGMVQRREMDGEGRSAGADQSRREPWKGKRGKSGASKETGTSSVRGHCKTEAERESSAGGEQFGKNGLADYHWALKEQCLCGEKLQKWRERKETLNSVHSICLFLFYCQARRTQKRDEKV